MKVLTIVGTRPELIKLSEVIRELDKHVDHILVHTGQNYDYELNQVFFDELGIRKPDYFMESVGVSTMDTIGNILFKTEEILQQEEPDAFLILGDTNSCLSAYVAKRKHIPIFHMEAGNRCFDERVPEEINRKIIDHISDINLVYTEHARRHLIQEGIKQEQIIKTGSPMVEVLSRHLDGINNSDICKKLGLQKNEYFLVSCHREENVDSTERLAAFIDILSRLSEIHSVIVSTHPRLKSRLGEIYKNDRVIFSKPFGFFDYCHLQKNAFCVISDSGTITEESSILRFPAVTIRQAHERPEGMDKGVLIMSDMIPDRVLGAVNTIVNQQPMDTKFVTPDDYININLSEQVVRLILSYTDYINRRTWYK